MAAFWDNQSDQFIKNKKLISMIQTQLLRLEPPYQIIAAGGNVGIQVATLIVTEDKTTPECVTLL